MIYRFVILLVLFTFGISTADAVNMKNAIWNSYGVSFKMPADIKIEEDSEESFVASSPVYYIEVQILDNKGVSLRELGKDLSHIAEEDGLTGQEEIDKFELSQFQGVKIAGKCDDERLMYSYLMAKDKSCAFFISISYVTEGDIITANILESFKME